MRAAAMAGDPDEEGRGRLPVRVLVVVLVAQLLLAAVIIWFSVNGWPFVGGGRDADPVPAGHAAAGGTVPPRFLPAPADGVPTPRTRRFDAAAAYALVARQVGYGLRPAGSPALRRLAADLRARLPAGARLEQVPGHPALRNIVATVPGRRPAIVVGAHYDTVEEPPGFVGANDGAAGAAVLVGLARALRERPVPTGAREVRFVLFDGEEAPAGSTDFLADGLRGSRAYVAAHRGQVHRMILLDYVGNRGLRLPREGTSSPALWARLRAAAQRTGTLRSFPTGVQPSIYDDHTPFLDAGIPAIDLIDWAYPWIHVPEDALDKISARSLDVTGETVLDLLLAERGR